jgi:hypothetical protein
MADASDRKAPDRRHPTFDILYDAMADVLPQKTETERLRIAFAMWESARQMIEQNLRNEHPDWSDAQIERAVAGRLSHGAV